MIWLEFVYLPHAIREDLLSDADWQRVERELLADPRAGALIAGTGGARKLRVRVQGRGKRGGARAIYLYAEENERIYFLATYAKNEAADLTPDDKAAIRRLIDVLRQERL